MHYIILPTSEQHFSSLYQALDIVAREKKFLVFLQVPPIDEALAFFRNIVANDCGKGLGTRLMKTTLAKASAKRLTRIELTVRTDNSNAKALYERFGFGVEGVQQASMFIDGEYHDAYAMALLR